jgi:hypothetical protein
MLVWKSCLSIVALLTFALLGSAAARADDTPPADGAKVESAVKNLDAVPATNGVDDLITNNNLRAYSGSKSRWSIASQFNYNGGTISSPLSQDRPDIANASATTTKADLDGSISAKYNIDTRSSILAGIGVRWIAPLSPKGPSNYDGSTLDAMNPYVTYQFIYKWLGIQSVIQAQAMQWTQSDQTALGYAQQFNIDQENMYEIGATRLSIGASVAVQYQTFNKSGSYGDPNSDNYIPVLAEVQSQYLFTIAPELEYQLTEKINLRTLVSLLTYEHYVSNSHLLSFEHDTIYQSIGVGFAVTRDIFLYPNIQFLPGQLQAAMTNVGLTATINLF